MHRILWSSIQARQNKRQFQNKQNQYDACHQKCIWRIFVQLPSTRVYYSLWICAMLFHSIQWNFEWKQPLNFECLCRQHTHTYDGWLLKFDSHSCSASMCEGESIWLCWCVFYIRYIQTNHKYIEWFSVYNRLTHTIACRFAENVIPRIEMLYLRRDKYRCIHALVLYILRRERFPENALHDNTLTHNPQSMYDYSCCVSVYCIVSSRYLPLLSWLFTEKRMRRT